MIGWQYPLSVAAILQIPERIGDALRVADRYRIDVGLWGDEVSAPE